MSILKRCGGDAVKIDLRNAISFVFAMLQSTSRCFQILLALIQLAIWGFYAPTHRMLHHSDLSRHAHASDSLLKCSSHCCSHHSSTAQRSTAVTKPRADLPPQCPEDDENCSLCIIAGQQGSAFQQSPLTMPLVSAEPLFGVLSTDGDTPVRSAFDSRGPPRLDISTL